MSNKPKTYTLPRCDVVSSNHTTRELRTC